MGRPKSRKEPAGIDPAPIKAEVAWDSEWIGRVREKLTAWYRESGREFPWRADRDPYRILVSETMLVQTTVAAVIPYFERFLRRFPDIKALANADEADVLKAWEGLGYYRRARQLHAAAKVVVEQHDGEVPSSAEALQGLPGVGRYIAGAVASFAFDLPAPIVEANTQRVLARWLAIESDIKTSASQAMLWEAARRLVPQTGAGEFNQAFMELGGTICSPKSPRCLLCPVASECRAKALGLQNQLPIASPKAPPLMVEEAAALVENRGEILVMRRPEGGLWGGFWEFPTIHLSGANPGRRLSVDVLDPESLAEGVRNLTGVKVQIGALAQTISFGVTRHKVRLNAFYADAMDNEASRSLVKEQVAWVRRETLAELTFGAASRRLFKLLGARESKGSDR